MIPRCFSFYAVYWHYRTSGEWFGDLKINHDDDAATAHAIWLATNHRTFPRATTTTNHIHILIQIAWASIYIYIYIYAVIHVWNLVWTCASSNYYYFTICRFANKSHTICSIELYGVMWTVVNAFFTQNLSLQNQTLSTNI